MPRIIVNDLEKSMMSPGLEKARVDHNRLSLWSKASSLYSCRIRPCAMLEIDRED